MSPGFVQGRRYAVSTQLCAAAAAPQVLHRHLGGQGRYHLLRRIERDQRQVQNATASDNRYLQVGGWVGAGPAPTGNRGSTAWEVLSVDTASQQG